MWTWYLTRGTGAAALILLTGSIVVGVAHTLRWRSRRLPRFIVDDLHRVISLLALGLVTAHVLTSILDTFAPVAIRDAFVPFAGTYRPTWLGLGALAFDLMLVLTATSIWRARLGYRAWRLLHWSAYACWPTALVHTLGTGSDIKRGWMLGLAAACTALVVIAIGARLWQDGNRIAPGLRAAAVASIVAGLVAMAVWLPKGPLGHGWARRSGTPLALLIPKQTAFRPTVARQPATRTRRVAATAHQTPLSAEARGVVRQGSDSSGTTLVDIALNLTSPERRRLDVRIAGSAESGGGVSLERSQVSFGPPRDPARYLGKLVALSGTRFEARLQPLRGAPLDVKADLVVDQSTGSASGRVDVRPAG